MSTRQASLASGNACPAARLTCRKIAEKLLCQNLRQVLVENKDWVAGSWIADIHPLFDLEKIIVTI